MSCPCKDCICVPICRHKKHYVLFDQCVLLKDYIQEFYEPEKRDPNKIFELRDILKPTLWDLVLDIGEETGVKTEYLKDIPVIISKKDLNI